MSSIREAIDRLRGELSEPVMPLEALAKKHNLPLSTIYRFLQNRNVRLATLCAIDDAVAKEKGAKVR